MARNQIAIKIAMRKDESVKSPGYGHYYPEVVNDETLSTRGLMEHIESHGLNIPRSIITACLTQLAQCLTELLVQGQPVKLDGFGTFKLEAHVAKDQAPTTLENGVDLNSVVDGLKLVVIPDNTELDKLTSKANKAKASMELAGVIVREPNGKQDKQGNALMASVVKPLNVYLAAQNPGNGG